MNIVALIIGGVAALMFLFEATRTHPWGWLPLGLSLLTVMLIVQFVWAAHTVVAH